MGKIYLYYKKHDSSQFGDILKVKIDDTITAEVKKNYIYELELADGLHNIKMYYEGWTKDELVGYIDQTIEIKGNTYFTYQGPIIITGKGKLTENKFNTPDEFRDHMNKKNTIYKVLSIVLFITALAILIVLNQ